MLEQSQEAVQRLQAQVSMLRQTAQDLSSESAAELEARTEQLREEGAATLDQVRSQMETVLYETVAAHEQSKVKLADARAPNPKATLTLDPHPHPGPNATTRRWTSRTHAPS